MSLKVDLKTQETRRGISFDYGWIFVVVFLLVAFVVYYIQGLRLQSVVEDRKRELQTWKDKVAGFSGIQGKLEDLRSQIGSIQTQITHLRELRYDPLRYSILLVRLSKLLPKNLWLSTLSIEPAQSQLTLAGTSLQLAGQPPLASLAEFLRNLQNDKENYFSEIVLQGTTASGKTGNLWTFTMTAKYNVPLIQSGSPSGTPVKAVAPPGAVTPPATSLGTTLLTTRSPAPAATGAPPSSPAPVTATPSPPPAAPSKKEGSKG